MLDDSDEFEVDDLAELEAAAGLPRYPTGWPPGDATEPDLSDDGGRWEPADARPFTWTLAGGCLLVAVLGGLGVVAALRLAFGTW